MIGSLLGVLGDTIAGIILARVVYSLNYALCFLIGFLSFALGFVFLTLNREPDLSSTILPPSRKKSSWGRIKTVMRENKNFRNFITSQGMTYLGSMAFGFVAVYSIQRFNLPDASAAIFTAILIGGGAVGFALWGFAGDNLGYKRVLIYSGLCWVLGLTLLIIAPSVVWVFPAFAFMSIANSGHFIGDINIVIRRSSDNGKSWSEIERIVDFPVGKSASDPSLIVDEVTGEIFLFYNFMDLHVEKDVYYLHVLKSTDNGKSWNKSEDITSQITKPEWHNDFKFITSGRGIQTSTGKLLHCMVNLDSGLRLFGSDDHGKSWYFIDTPIKPGNESKVVELKDGSWMINSRSNGKGMRFVHVSTDQGATWCTRAEPNLIDPGCNGSIIRYTSTENGDKKNRLLFSNAKMEKGRKNMTVRVSYDEGETWTKGKTIYPGGSAYSSLTVLETGDIGLIFEKDNYTENVFVSFSLPWLTDGEDKL